MNRADRRAAARASRKGHDLDCGCTALGHYVGQITCTNPRCGRVQDVDCWMPTSRDAGDSSVIYGFCVCDWEAVGLVPIVETDHG